MSKEKIHKSWDTYLKDMNTFLVKELIRKKIRRPINDKTHAKIYRYLHEFCEKSTFHGCKQLAARGRHWIEYLLWSTAMLVSLGMTLYVSKFSWNRYQHYPTVIIMEKNNHDWSIAFPTAIICPDAKVDRGILEALAMNYKVANTDDFVNFFESLSKSTFETYAFLPDYDEVPPEEFLKIIVLAKNTFFYNVSTTMTLETEYLDPIFTEYGICYAYNSKVAPYLNPSVLIGETEPTDHPGDPYFITIYDDDSFALVSMELSDQYNLSISGPYDIPAEGSALLPSLSAPTKEIQVACLPIISTDEVRELSVQQRNCRTRSDGTLRVSTVYSYNLCRMECRLKLSYTLCGCIPYIYVNEQTAAKNEKIPICDVKGMKCLGLHGTWLSDLRHPETRKKEKCNCHSLCTDYIFRVLSFQDYDWGLRRAKWQMAMYPKARYKRTIIFGFPDMIVGIGSTAGLFMGCSVLSFVELAYFFTLRLAFVIYAKRKAKNPKNDQSNFRKTKKINTFEFFN